MIARRLQLAPHIFVGLVLARVSLMALRSMISRKNRPPPGTGSTDFASDLSCFDDVQEQLRMLRHDPDLVDMFEDLRVNGFSAFMHHYQNETLMSHISHKMTRLTDAVSKTKVTSPPWTRTSTLDGDDFGGDADGGEDRYSDPRGTGVVQSVQPERDTAQTLPTRSARSRPECLHVARHVYEMPETLVHEVVLDTIHGLSCPVVLYELSDISFFCFFFNVTRLSLCRSGEKKRESSRHMFAHERSADSANRSVSRCARKYG